MNMKLRAAREASGKTQGQVAQKIGVSTRVYQSYEYGTSQPSVKRALRIALVLGSTVEELFGDASDDI